MLSEADRGKEAACEMEKKSEKFPDGDKRKVLVFERAKSSQRGV
jgi:hypothetical protein